MESVWGSVQLMLFVYALATVISLAVAGIIKLIFAGIRMQGNNAAARTAPEPANGAGERKA